MNLKLEELVKALLYCGNGGDCDSCCHPCHGEHGEFEWRCLGPLLLRAATQIERDQKKIEELRAALEKATEMADALNKNCDLITKKLEQLSDAYPVVGDSEEGHAMNEPLTLQELVELNGQPVWMGEPFNQWTTISIDPKYILGITPGMKIRKGAMNVNGERVEIPPVDFYRYPPKEDNHDA